MLSKLLNDPAFREKGLKIIAVLIILAVMLLSFDVLTQTKDGRRQIVDDDGGTEAELCAILSDIEGVGEVDVMLQYDDSEKITGAIVTAEGAGDPVVRNNVVKAVMALFDISASGVEVFEKSSEGSVKEDRVNENQR